MRPGHFFNPPQTMCVQSTNAYTSGDSVERFNVRRNEEIVVYDAPWVPCWPTDQSWQCLNGINEA